MSTAETISNRQVAWLKKIATSPANKDRPELQKIYHFTLDGMHYTFAVAAYYFVCVEGKMKGTIIAPATMTDKISDYLSDTRRGTAIMVRSLRSWAGPPDWDNKHHGCIECNGSPGVECNYCDHGVTMRACDHCGQTHPCGCKQCDGKGTLRCTRIQRQGWINSVMVSRQMISQAINGITVGDIIVADGSKTEAVYFSSGNIRSFVMPINQDQVTEDEIKGADRFQFGRKE